MLYVHGYISICIYIIYMIYVFYTIAIWLNVVLLNPWLPSAMSQPMEQRKRPRSASASMSMACRVWLLLGPQRYQPQLKRARSCPPAATWSRPPATTWSPSFGFRKRVINPPTTCRPRTYSFGRRSVSVDDLQPDDPDPRPAWRKKLSSVFLDSDVL